MKKGLLCLALFFALALAVGVLGCGGSEKIPIGDGSPQAVLTAAMDAAETLQSASGSFDVSVKLDADTSQMPEETAAMFKDPIKVSGDFAFTGTMETAQYSISVLMAGQSMDMGVALRDGKGWLRVADQWYEAPPEVMQSMTQSTADQQKIEEISRLVKELGVDPVTWFSELTVAGEEKIDGTTTYHLTGKPDPAKMMTDVMSLTQSKELMSLLDPSGSMAEGFGMGMLPSPDELQQAQSMLAQIFQDLKFDLWVTKDRQEIRKAVVAAHLAPPVGEDTGGIKSIDVAATILLDAYNQPVEVQAPSSARPFDQLQKDMQENPDKFFGPFMSMGMMGSGLGESGF